MCGCVSILLRGQAAVILVHILYPCMCLCMCLHACMWDWFEDVGFNLTLILHPSSSLKSHFSFGLMVECLSNFCLAQGPGFQGGNKRHPLRKQASICLHKTSQHWWLLWQLIYSAVDLHSLSQKSKYLDTYANSSTEVLTYAHIYKWICFTVFLL